VNGKWDNQYAAAPARNTKGRQVNLAA